MARPNYACAGAIALLLLSVAAFYQFRLEGQELKRPTQRSREGVSAAEHNTASQRSASSQQHYRGSVSRPKQHSAALRIGGATRATHHVQTTAAPTAQPGCDEAEGYTYCALTRRVSASCQRNSRANGCFVDSVIGGWRSRVLILNICRPQLPPRRCRAIESSFTRHRCKVCYSWLHS
jgi:hypothetical protein